MEAVAAIPNQPGHFIALTAYGDVFRFSVDKKHSGLALEKSFKIPTASYRASKPEFEGFVIQSVNGKEIAVWAERGWNRGEYTAQMWWSTFDSATNSFGKISKPVQVGTQLETKCKRHISDIKVAADGRVYISSATDCDDTNKPPFESAAFEIGRFILGKDNAFHYSSNGKLKIFDGSREWKIEAFEFMPPGTGRFIFGTDDELDGGKVFVQW